MSDISPPIPLDCDLIIVKSRFLVEGSSFAGYEYQFTFKKLTTLLGVTWHRTIQSAVVRTDVFIPTDEIEKNGKPSLVAFEAFVKDWKRDVIGDKWSEMDYYYMKVVSNA